MSNITLNDVTAVLFKEFENIDNNKLTGDKLTEQLERTKAKISVSKEIISAARLALDAQKALPDMLHGAELPPMLRIEKK
jgi:hypothetical protein